MDNKQIIIDGVDVSGCKHYEDHTLYDCNETCEINGGIVCTKCKDNPNCYYKQLKRKEQECEELKAKIKYIEEYIKTVENARNEFKKESNFLKEENKRLKQTLAKIKDYCNKYPQNSIGFKKYILQKISECKGEYNEKIR